MKSLWRWGMVSVVLLCGSSIVGCVNTWKPARPLSESKFTIEEARAIVADGGRYITDLRADVSGGRDIVPLRDLSMSKKPGNSVSLNITVKQARVEFQGRYNDSLGGTVMVIVPHTDRSFVFQVFQYYGPGSYAILYVGGPEIHLDFTNEGNAMRFAEAMMTLRDYAAMGQFIGQEKTDNFAQSVAWYQKASPKPTLSEEARKFKVQADYAVEKQQYTQAIEHYQEALKIAPWWAEGHFNRALLLGEEESFLEAITEMKKYLALEPNANDARAAQDKVYQWEGQVKTAKVEIRIQERGLTTK